MTELASGDPTFGSGSLRLTLRGSGSTLTGRLFEDGVLRATLSASDATHAAGVTGLLVLNSSGSPAGTSDASFDDFASVQPGAADSDSDGMTDGFEVANGFDPLDSIDGGQDADSDGLTNAGEEAVGTNAHNADSDDDGMLDGFEVNEGFDPLDPIDSDQDADADGLANVFEELFGTDPHDADSDDDGLSDGAEVYQYATGPLDADSDNDGLSDGAEVNTHGTDPLDADSDGDGASDGAEVAIGANPLVATAFPFLGVPAALNTNAAIDSGADSFVALANDGTGNWVAVWSSTDSLGGTIGTDPDILVARSTDSGASWTAPVALNTNAATDSTALDSEPRVSTDGAGNWLAVWSSNSTLGGTIGSDFDILISRSTNGGATWTAPVALNTNAATDGSAVDAGPKVTTDAAGSWVAVWLSNNTLGGTIGSDYDILVSRSTDAGATWTAPAPLDTQAATDGSAADLEPVVSTDGLGNWLAVWDTQSGTLGSDHDIRISRSTNAGATWSASVGLDGNAATDSGDDYSVQVATDGAGQWVAVWNSITIGGPLGSDVDILVARSSDAGASWTSPVALHGNAATDSGFDTEPQIATDGAGQWVAVWQSNDTLGGTLGSDNDILMVRSSNAGTSWTAPVALHSNAGSDSGSDTMSIVASDGAGRWVAAWRSTDTLGGTLGTDNDLFFTTSGSDSDSDGLANGVEAMLGTNPFVADSDGDGLEDGDERSIHGTDPLDPDSDGDGLGDGDEVNVHGTDPLDVDSDGDGIGDGQEVIGYGTDPADSDSDDDGFSDGYELIAGTDPLDPQSVPPPIPLPGLGGWGSAVLAMLLLAAARGRLRPASARRLARSALPRSRADPVHPRVGPRAVSAGAARLRGGQRSTRKRPRSAVGAPAGLARGFASGSSRCSRAGCGART